MLPRFNGGAYSPVTPNNGNPNTVYNTSAKAQPYVPQFASSRPLNHYGTFTTPQIADSNADTRSPMAITMAQPEMPSGVLPRTSLGVNLDFWRSRLGSPTTGLQPLPVPGITLPGPGAGGSPAPPGGGLPSPEVSVPSPSIGPVVRPDIPRWEEGETAVPSNRPDFWRTWNSQQAINQAGLNRNTPLNNDLRTRSGGLGSVGDIVDAAQRELAGMIPSSGRDWLRLLADVGLFPGAGDALLPRFNIPIPGATDDNPAGIERGVEGMDAMMRANLTAYRRELQAEGMPGAELSDAQLIQQARDRLQRHYDGQEQMRPQDLARTRELVNFITAFQSGNAASLVGSPMSQVGRTGATGQYIAPGAAVMLNDFTTASTRSGGQTPQERLRQFMSMVNRRGGTQER